MSTAKNAGKITEKNTKGEIWEEYNKLLVRLGGQAELLPLDEKRSEANTALRDLAELKIKLGDELDGAGQKITDSLNSLSELQNKIAKDRQAAVEAFGKQQQDLEAEMQKIRGAWQIESKEQEEVRARAEEELKTTRKREGEEYHYNLLIARRKEQDDYAAKKIAQEKILADREKILKEKEEEIAQMEKELTALPARLEQTAKEASDITAKELTNKYTVEIRELKLVHDHEKRIAELKIANLESLVKSQNSEIDNLKRQIENSTKQVKDIAVSVIEGRAAQNKAIAQTTSPNSEGKPLT